MAEGTVTVGVGLTVTTAVVVPVQTPDVPVITYVCVFVGLADTLDPEVELNPVLGLQT